tara:strand:- start:92 stop:988 length:897 start_codon:yes stop_codon:yes gene_type:complete
VIKKSKISRKTTILIVTINGYVSTKTIKNLCNNYKIIIIENNKNFVLKKKLKKFKNVNVFFTKYNLGFGGGNNFGLKKIKTPYVLLLGPDAEISKKSVDLFEKFSQEIRDSSILTAPIKDFEKMMDSKLDKGDKEEACIRINNKISKLSWVPEWCMYCSLKDLKKVNYFDENYFLYFEGLDLCKRLKKIGKNFYLIKQIRIKHFFAGTSENLNESKKLSHWKLRFWHFYWSSFYFHKKHYGYFRSFQIHLSKFLRFFVKKNYLYLRGKKNYDYVTTKAKFDGILSQILGKKSYFRINL